MAEGDDALQHRPDGLMRRLAVAGVVAAVLVGALGVADLALAEHIEQRTAAHVGAALGAEVTATVHGRPLVWHLVEGSLPRVDIRAGRGTVPDASVRVESIDATLRDVQLDLRNLADDDEPVAREVRDGRAVVELGDVAIEGTPLRLTSLRLLLPVVRGDISRLGIPGALTVLDTPGGRFEATLSEEDATALLGVPGVAVRFHPGEAILDVGALPIVVAMDVHDGGIELQPTSPLLALVLRGVGPLVLRLELPPGATLERIHPGRGTLELDGQIDRFEIPGR
jgi:hypothetical protein